MGSCGECSLRSLLPLAATEMCPRAIRNSKSSAIMYANWPCENGVQLSFLLLAISNLTSHGRDPTF